MNKLIFIINKFHTYNNSMIYNLLMLQKYKITKDNKRNQKLFNRKSNIYRNELSFLFCNLYLDFEILFISIKVISIFTILLYIIDIYN